MLARALLLLALALPSSCKQSRETGPASADGGAAHPAMGSRKPSATDPQASITLRRTECYGACPEYQVSILADGSVVYIGGDHVRVRGQEKAKVDPEKARALFDRFDQVGFWSWKDEYRIGITDNPSAVLSLYAHGRTKRVVDYPPCHFKDAAPAIRPPRELCELERAVDALANSQQWVRCRDDAGVETGCPSKLEEDLAAQPRSDAGCDPPWELDPGGLKRFKPHCL